MVALERNLQTNQQDTLLSFIYMYESSGFSVFQLHVSNQVKSQGKAKEEVKEKGTPHYIQGKCNILLRNYGRWSTTSNATIPPVKPVVPPAPPVQLPAKQDQPVPLTQPRQPVPPVLNWSHFKPEFSGKPEDGAEAQILRTNDYIETHNFPEVIKMQRFCLTLTGEARLWYESRPIVIDCQGLQDQFRQEYSKIGNI